VPLKEPQIEGALNILRELSILDSNLPKKPIEIHT
jgi:hypothetical protein